MWGVRPEVKTACLVCGHNCISESLDGVVGEILRLYQLGNTRPLNSTVGHSARGLFSLVGNKIPLWHFPLPTVHRCLFPIHHFVFTLFSFCIYDIFLQSLLPFPFLSFLSNFLSFPLPFFTFFPQLILANSSPLRGGRGGGVNISNIQYILCCLSLVAQEICLVAQEIY